MNTSPELLRFFRTEADEYLGAIEQLVAANAGAPDAGAFVAAARAMRGSATMARVPRVAELALALEQIGNELRDGELTWSVALQEELRDTTYDLRMLIEAAGNWSATEEQRAARRLSALRRHLPNESPRPTPPSPAMHTAPMFIALQAAAIGADLDRFAAEPGTRTVIEDIVSRVRSLRGIAGVADHPPLGEVADATENSLRTLVPDAPLTDSELELFRAAAGVFRRASADLRTRGRINLASGEIARFVRASAALGAPSPSASPPPVVPIDALFYADAGPHVIERGTPPTTPPQTRFRDESVTRAEHVRRLLAEGRTAVDPISRDRVRRDLRLNLERMEEFAASYHAQATAGVFGEAARARDPLQRENLDVVDAAVQIMLMPGLPMRDLEARMSLFTRARNSAQGAPTAVAPAPLPAPPVHPTPSGAALQAMLQEGLDGLRSLDAEPLSAPAVLETPDIVPVESLLYRGRAALARAIELRDSMRKRGAVDAESLNELYDLLDLARAE